MAMNFIISVFHPYGLLYVLCLKKLIVICFHEIQATELMILKPKLQRK